MSDSEGKAHQAVLPRSIPALDGLRGLAALIVLVSHCANAGFLPHVLGDGFGRTGVDMFYALSGFLMAHVCFHKPITRTTLRSYGVARGSRVLPLFYTVVLADLAFLLVTQLDFYGIRTPLQAAENLLLIHGDQVLWSVPVEIQFYVIFIGIWWARHRGQLGLMLAGLLAFSAAMIFLQRSGHYPLSLNTLPLWLHFFVIGVVMHELIERNFARLRELGQGFVGRVLALVALALLLLLPGDLRALGGLPAFAPHYDPVVIVLVPLLLAGCCSGQRLFDLLAHPVMRWFGRISYSLYLLHWPVVQSAHYVDLGAWITPAGGLAAILVVAIGAATLSNRLIERPMQDWLRARLTPRVAPPVPESDFGPDRQSPPSAASRAGRR